jgi:hypothetical protein
MGRLIICCRAEGQFTLAPPQHFLYFFPEPHGHGSFRPTLGVLRWVSLVWAPGLTRAYSMWGSAACVR